MAERKHKDWFDKELAILLSGKIKPHYAKFDDKTFIKRVDQGTKPLELKDRLSLISDELHALLPAEYPKAVDILTAALGPENKAETGMFTTGYWVMPIATFAERYGHDHFMKSMNFIKEITKRNTGEYSVRPYIEKYPEKSIKLLEKWSTQTNVHVRRLSCEGSRPRLPWAKKLDQFINDPSPLLAILDNLKDDDSNYVQKSVANTVNDIFKDNPEFAMKLIKQWNKNPTANRRWIIKHALRNQVKKGVPEALKIVAKLK